LLCCFYYIIQKRKRKELQEIEKALQQNAKGLGMVWLPLLNAFRTFKGSIATENIRLNQLILQY